MARNHIQGYSGNILDVNPDGSLKAQSKIAGKATESSANRTTLVDSYKNLIVNKYQDDIIVVTINSISYYRVIASNTADTYTFAALPDDDGDGNEVRVVVGSVYQIIESAAFEELIEELKGENDRDLSTLQSSVETMSNDITGEEGGNEGRSIANLLSEIGLKSDAAQTDPSENATSIAALKGLLTLIAGLQADGETLQSVIDGITKTGETAKTLKDLDDRLAIFESAVDQENNTFSVEQRGSFVAIDSSGNITDENVREYRGMSTDTKPTSDVPTYSTFLEMDTQTVYYFDGSSWEVLA